MTYPKTLIWSLLSVSLLVSRALLAQPLKQEVSANRTPAAEPLFEGLGSTHHPVSTKSQLAQRYFDQGLKFTYGFNHDEAESSFGQAAKVDPEMAMAYWGIALVLGPNYNLPGDKERGVRAATAMKKAKSLEAGVTPEERDLIEALMHRYGVNGEPSADRDAGYARAMRSVAQRYPEDADVQVLFAESLMDVHPWRLWTSDGKPGENTVEIVTTLEGVLRKHPDHLGANHYYIHAVEASPDPARALPSADRLGALAPRAGHLVHMPSHIYMRTGRYHEAAVVNARAVKVDTDFLRKTGEIGFYPLSYYTHNYHFLCYAETMEGRGRAALETARELERHLPLDKVRTMRMAEYLVPIPYFVEARFAMWNEVLHEPEPPKDLLYTTGIWHYARGMALAADGQLEQALDEQRALEKTTVQTASDYPLGTSNHAKDVLTLASTLLTGEIAVSKGDHDNALAKLARTVKLQDALVYDEPPDWYYPVRESLGAELLAAGEPSKAETVYQEDLKLNPGNPRSLYGLAQALKKEGKQEEATATEKLFRASWQCADSGKSVLSDDDIRARAGGP